MDVPCHKLLCFLICKFSNLQMDLTGPRGRRGYPGEEESALETFDSFTPVTFVIIMDDDNTVLLLQEELDPEFSYFLILSFDCSVLGLQVSIVNSGNNNSPPRTNLVTSSATQHNQLSLALSEPVSPRLYLVFQGDQPQAITNLSLSMLKWGR